MQLYFFDDQPQAFFPLTYTRNTSELRMGSLTLAQKWLIDLGDAYSITTDLPGSGDTIYINSRWLARPKWRPIIEALQVNEALVSQGKFLAVRQKEPLLIPTYQHLITQKRALKEIDDVAMISRITDLFSMNNEELKYDFDRLTTTQKSEPLPPGNLLIGDAKNLFIAPGAKVQGATLNVSEGTIYIGPDAEIMEGALIRGPFSLGAHATVKMGAKIYGGTTIGPWSKIGGEVSNSVVLGYSNKGHDGFLGNSVLGMWCNLGADTNTSNLKNNYSNVRMWSYASKKMEDTGLTFCGLVMGDHSKCGINTMFNTGTTVGVSANIFGSGFPPKFIPSFSWGDANNLVTYELDKALEAAERMMARRNQVLTAAERQLLTELFVKSAEFRQ